MNNTFVITAVSLNTCILIGLLFKKNVFAFASKLKLTPVETQPS